jgi:hypothetical protein
MMGFLGLLLLGSIGPTVILSPAAWYAGFAATWRRRSQQLLRWKELLPSFALAMGLARYFNLFQSAAMILF